MKFGYCIVYVSSVVETVGFYNKAFQLKTYMLHESNQYAELDTGDTKLAFADETVGAQYECLKNRCDSPPAGIEVALICDDVSMAYKYAVKHGAKAQAEPKEMPWGQTVAYVRDLNGVLVELCSAIQK